MFHDCLFMMYSACVFNAELVKDLFTFKRGIHGLLPKADGNLSTTAEAGGVLKESIVQHA